MILSLVQMLNPEADSFMTTQPTGEQERQQSTIPLAFQSFAVRCLPESHTLRGAQPVPQAYAKVPHTLDTPNAGSKIRTK